MNEIDWAELKQIFAEVCELGPEERGALLAKRCAGKPELRAELEEYLRQHAQLEARTPRAEPPGPRATEDDDTRRTPTAELVRRLKEHSPEQPRYQLRGEIARGGMGAILKVWDEDLRRHLAMKVVLGRAGPASGDGTPAVDPLTLGRFLEEAQVTGQLDHPGIVPVHELGLDDEGRVYFTMKLVKGRDLKEIFRLVFAGREGWNETRALGVLLKACEAMAYAHKKGVIHRDLKPANVMVGNFGEVYVMDWGLARVRGQEDSHDIRIAPEFTTDLSSARSERREEREALVDSPILTRDGDVMGTPAYMAPEQARGETEKLGPRSDVYSMGAMIYHLLARHAPYLGPGTRISNRTLLALVLQGPPAALGSLRGDLPQELVAICEKAMAREASQRYADTLELAEDLRAFLEHRVVGAYETGAWAEARKWVQRNRALAASLATAVLLLVAGLTTSLVYKSRAEEKEALATQKTNDLLSLSAIQDLKELEDRADALWPATPEMVPKYEAWLADARVLIEGRPADPARGIKARPGLAEHEAQLAEIRKRARPLTPEQVEADRRSSPAYAELERTRAHHTWCRRMLGEEPWPSEAEIEVELAQEKLPTDAAGLNELAWRLVDVDGANTIYGGEVRGLVLARRAVAAANTIQRGLIRNTLSWALYRCGRLEEALAEDARVHEECPPGREEQMANSSARLHQAIDPRMSAAGHTAEAEELAQLGLRLEALEREVAERRTYEFEASEDRWWHAQLSSLVASLRLFSDERTGGLYSRGISEKHGWSVPRRLEFAASIRERSTDGIDARLRWDEAVAAIEQSAKYGGLKLKPQLGLLPLGADPNSGLWEFAHLQSGEPAQRSGAGSLDVQEGTGVVFVLIPGGKFWMGAQRRDPQGPNYDTGTNETEFPPHEVTLSPFFLSKYEMSQGQWLRITGTNPSLYGPTWRWNNHPQDLTHPLENVSWYRCEQVLARIGLQLATEAQWEYGCRGGTSTPWSTGAERESLRGMANLADQSAARNGLQWEAIQDWPDLDDGWMLHSPVGSYPSNPFGLHDMHGNVWEWCLDGYHPYNSLSVSDPVQTVGSQGYVSRGGAFNYDARTARSAYRMSAGPDTQGFFLGLRPARRIDP